MPTNSMFALVAALAGDPTRAAMLQALANGQALTAGELARAAGVAPQTASGHLHRMAAGGLLSVERQGRLRNYRLAGEPVAQMLESILRVAARLEPHRRRAALAPPDAALRRARTCYDHLAGRLAVALADTFVARRHVEFTSEAGIVTESGLAFLREVGIDVAPLTALRTRRSRRVLCKPCLDWSERRAHFAGALGAAICAHCFARGWIRRMEGTRAVAITRAGEKVFRDTFAATIG